MQEIAQKMIIEAGISTGENLEFFCIRRWKWLIFRDRVNDIFIRFWEKEKLRKEFDLHSYFIANNFPVSEITTSFENEDNFLYAEKSIWEEKLGRMIRNQTITYKEAIEILNKILSQYLEAQYKTINKGWNFEEAKKFFHLDIFEQENSELKNIDENLVKMAFKKIKKGFINQDFALTHWDFNTMNIFEWWVIDIEDSYNGLLGFDIVTLITHNYWFPTSWAEMNRAYSFEIEDIYKFFEIFNEITWKNLEELFDLCFMTRWIWSCSNMNDRPIIQKFRFERMAWYMESYIKWEKLLPKFLEEVKEININTKQDEWNWSENIWNW